jgi:putative sterol carrier protein
MALKLGTQEWIEAMAEQLRADATYQEKSKGFNAYYQFICEPSDGVDERRACGVHLPDAQETWVGEREESDYVMSGTYGVYYDVLKGKLGATMAIATRKLRVRGNLANLLRYTGAINRFVELMQGLEIEIEGDAAK